MRQRAAAAGQSQTSNEEHTVNEGSNLVVRVKLNERCRGFSDSCGL